MRVFTALMWIAVLVSADAIMLDGEMPDKLTILSFMKPVLSMMKPIKYLSMLPGPKVISQQTLEFHECIACNENKTAGADFQACLFALSPKIRMINQECCKKTFGNDFCERAGVGHINFGAICTDPSKAIEVEQCAWKSIDDGTTPEVQAFRKCKLNVYKTYCPPKSSF